MHDEYKKLAYEKAVWDHLLSRMEGELIVEDIQPTYFITCDVLPYDDRMVPQSILKDVASRLRKFSIGCAGELTKFEMTRKKNGSTKRSGKVVEQAAAVAEPGSGRARKNTKDGRGAKTSTRPAGKTN